MKILLLSGYDAASHKRWREQLVAHLDTHEWTSLALPPRFFSWRLRGNPLTWAYTHREILEQPYDRLVVTSMVDLSVLRGLVPSLARIPTLVYFHENQFAYPIREAAVQREVFHFCMHNMYTALCADTLLFNSEYNRATFLEGVHTLLRKMPDHSPKDAHTELTQRASVLPVPLEEHWYAQRTQQPEGPLSIVWNHRWEYDKAPERFFGALRHLVDNQLPFKVHVVGQRFRTIPDVFSKARDWLEPHLGEWGYIETREAYIECLRSSDIVVSTALHDFQGLAMLEAVAAGCFPIAPDRLAYPQWFPQECRYASFIEDAEQEEQALADALTHWIHRKEELRNVSVPDVSHLAWKVWAPQYETYIQETSLRHNLD